MPGVKMPVLFHKESGRDNSGLQLGLIVVLYLGVGLSLLTLLAGLVMQQLYPQAGSIEVPLEYLLTALFSCQPAAVSTLGLVFLLSTLIIGVIVTVIKSLVARDWFTGAVSFAVFLIIITGFLLAWRA